MANANAEAKRAAFFEKNPKAEISGLFGNLPPSVIKAWVDGDIENLRHDPETGRFSFRVADGTNT